MENSTQKISKISISSSDYGDSQSENSIEYERTPAHSMHESNDKLLSLISTLQLALQHQGLKANSVEDPMDTLTCLISEICTKYLRATQTFSKASSENLKESNLNLKSYVNESYVEENLLDSIINPPDAGLRLTKVDCRELSGLLVGLIRDSSSDGLRKKIDKLEITLVNCGKNISQLKQELKEKEEQLQLMKDELQHIKPRQSYRARKLQKNKHLESESTLNESEDTMY